jgi:hypothetical protein
MKKRKRVPKVRVGQIVLITNLLGTVEAVDGHTFHIHAGTKSGIICFRDEFRLFTKSELRG